MAVVDGTILALDVGDRRIGMAIATTQARFPHPAGVVFQGDTAVAQLSQLCERKNVVHVVIGLPRGLSGQDTVQTTKVRTFGALLAQHVSTPITWQDEAVTSAHAEAELKNSGKPYTKEDIDALAATYILEDYLRENV